MTAKAQISPESHKTCYSLDLCGLTAHEVVYPRSTSENEFSLQNLSCASKGQDDHHHPNIKLIDKKVSTKASSQLCCHLIGQFKH